MTIVRNYAAPTGLISRAPDVLADPSAANYSSPYDTSGLGFTYGNPALDSAINATFQDMVGREATPEEIAKYRRTGDFAAVAGDIYKDNVNHGAQVMPDRDSEGNPVYLNAEQYGYDYLKTKADPQELYMASISDQQWRAPSSEDARFSNQEVAQFLTRMSPEQSANVFKDTGLSDEQATSYANWIAGQDWNGVGVGDLQKKIGLNDAQISEIGKAMFSDRDLNSSGNLGGGRNDVAFQNSGNRYAVTTDAAGNNTDYLKNTAYSSEQGLHFTGGYVPEKQKTDWMGNIVLGVLLGGVGAVAGAAIGAGATAAGASGTAATVGGAAGTGVAGTVGAIGGGAVAGGVGATMTGGDVGKGMLTGGVMGGIGSMGTPSITGNRAVDTTAWGAARGAAGSAISGGDPLTGAVAGGVSSLTSPMVKSYVPGIAGDMVNRYVNTAIKASMADAPSQTYSPAVQTYATQPTEPIAPVDLTTTRRIIRR